MPPARARFQTAAPIAVIVICLTVLTWWCWPIHRYVFQIYGVAAVAIALRTTTPVSCWLRALPMPHRIVLGVLLAAVVAGHFTLQQKKYFPFVVWDIFSGISNQETVFCRELIGTTESGAQVRLLVEQLFPSIIQFDLPPDDEPDKLELLVAALAKQYDARHPADPVRAVDLMLMAVKVHLPPGQTRSQPSCELLQRFELSPVHSS